MISDIQKVFGNINDPTKNSFSEKTLTLFLTSVVEPASTMATYTAVSPCLHKQVSIKSISLVGDGIAPIAKTEHLALRFI